MESKPIVESEPEVLEGQDCPFCHKKTLTMTEQTVDIPFFGMMYIFSAACESCKYHKADIEAAETKPAAIYTFEISSEEDMHVRIVKSSEATVKLPHIISMEPGLGSNGYITNIEGLLNRAKNMIEVAKENSEDEADKKKAKNLLKKIQNIMWGREKQKLIIEDKTGNSAIISDKAEVKKL